MSINASVLNRSMRLPRNGFALDELLRIAIPLVDAIAAAHSKGITHRDLKPANIMLGVGEHEGRVKILDFGLARLVQAALEPAGPTASPTMTLTGEGRILGTASYMSPEQAEGKPLDTRSDLFSLGVILYEMATGRRPFTGDTNLSIVASIIKDTPPSVTELEPALPRDLARLIRRALIKNPDERYQTARDLRSDLEDLKELLQDSTSATRRRSRPVVPEPRAPRPTRGLWIVAAVALGALLVTAGIRTLVGSPPQDSGPIVRSVIATLPASGTEGLAISPDGRLVVYEASGRLYVRPLDQVESQLLRGAEGGVQPEFSPDGESVAFFVPRESKIKRVSIGGGPATPVTHVDGGRLGGLSWGPNGGIVFATGAGLWRVSDVGGEPERLTSAAGQADIAHFSPHVLANGRGVLFNALREGRQRIAIVSLDTRRVWYTKVVGVDPSYASGRIVFATPADGLRAVGFDPVRLAVTDETTVPVVESVQNSPARAGKFFGMGGKGSLVYVPGDAGQPTLVWVDRAGREEPLAFSPRRYEAVRVAPDGKRIAAQFSEAGRPTAIWVSELGGSGWNQIASPPHVLLPPGYRDPAWTRDSDRIAFKSDSSDGFGLFWARSDGTGEAEALLKIDGNAWLGCCAVLPDDSLLFGYGRPSEIRIGRLSMKAGSDGKRPWVPHPPLAYRASSVSVSPDGRLIAYQSPFSGRCEVYVERYPNLGGRRVISTEPGGGHPVWSRNGQELHYQRLGDGAMMAVPIQTSPTLTIGTPEALFVAQDRYPCAARDWDVAPDGRFLMIKDAPGRQSDGLSQSGHIIHVQNWDRGLKRRVPTR